jgi:hypothetical protein
MENVSLSDYIEVIRVLPDLVLTEVGIIPEDTEHGDDLNLLNSRRKVYRAKADWLKYYLLNDIDIKPELILTKKVMYKPHAEETVAIYNLAQEVYLRHPEAQENFDSPGQWMFCCEAELCKSSLEATGFLSQPKMMGKSEMYRSAVKKASHYEAVNKIPIVKSSSKNSVTPRAALEMLAVVLSKEDITFKKYWLEYLRQKKQVSRTLRGKGYVNRYLGDDGKIVELGVGKSGKPRAKKKKGFCKAM